MPTKDYAAKRRFDETPEPQPEVPGDVDPGTARPGETFVIHQHHATRLHYDLRLEMFNGRTPVLVSWAVPKNLPLEKGKPNLAVHVEDHPFEYGSFSGTIPKGNYGAGEVRIFDNGTYEVLEQEPGKVTFRLHGERLQGVWHLFRTAKGEEKDWLVRLREWEGPEPEPLPVLSPMMATLQDEPFDDDEWVFEPKWDGIRAIATCSRDETFLLSRTGRDITSIYPELQKLHERMVCNDCIVDGEIVAMEGGRPSFEKLQGRMNLQNPRDIDRAVRSIPITYVLFDVLYMDGRSLVSLPLQERKQILSDLVVESDVVTVSSCIEGDGVSLFESAKQMQLEGIVGKKLGCPYQPGKRVKHWVKVKTIYTADVVVGGWSRGEGSRSSTFGSLIVGAYDAAGNLRYIGNVGTGFNEKLLGEVLPRLEELESERCPFAEDPRRSSGGRWGKPLRDPRWVDPQMVVRVEYRELTSQGKLRAPSFKGIVPDKEPGEVAFEHLEGGSLKEPA